MRIRKLKLTNFRPFLGEHEIDLSPAEGNSLVLIHGENMSGKTAFFLALYWCLYDQAKSRLGLTLPIFQPGEDENDYLINRRAVEDGDNTVQVEMVFEHEGEEWQLTRTATCDGDPFDGGKFETKALLRIGDEPIVAAEIQRKITDVLNNDAAQFYFFDGELLSQYEQWLADPKEAQERVKEAIERTVGISAFRLGGHLAAVADDFQKDVNKALRKEKRNQDLLDERDRKEKRKAEIQAEIRNYQTETGELSAAAEKIRQIHGDLTAWSAAMVAIGQLETQITEEQERERNTLIEIQRLVRERYWMPLDRLARSMDAEVLAQVSRAFRSGSHLISSSIDKEECALCLRDLDKASRSHLQEQLAEVEEEGGQPQTVEEIREALVRVEQARQFIDPSAMGHLDTLEGHLTASRIEIERCETDARALRRDHPVRGNLEKEMRRLQEIHQELGRLEETRAAAQAELEGVLGEIKSLDARISRSGTTDPALSRRSRASSLAADAFEAALETFSHRSREKVQEGATRAFKALVRDEGYDGIHIDRHYVVRPVDADGKVQTAPSSGGQQLLTLALIAGLNSTAVHDAPIVMDTPFGRLDVGNRERILNWVNALVQGQKQQVILMVHSGELTRQDLKEWGIAPGRSYKIEVKEVHQHAISAS